MKACNIYILSLKILLNCVFMLHGIFYLWPKIHTALTERHPVASMVRDITGTTGIGPRPIMAIV